MHFNIFFINFLKKPHYVTFVPFVGPPGGLALICTEVTTSSTEQTTRKKWKNWRPKYPNFKHQLSSRLDNIQQRTTMTPDRHDPPPLYAAGINLICAPSIQLIVNASFSQNFSAVLSSPQPGTSFPVAGSVPTIS